jgi:predicted metallo-beta-lactamase superfamily hydrolase
VRERENYQNLVHQLEKDKENQQIAFEEIANKLSQKDEVLDAQRREI